MPCWAMPMSAAADRHMRLSPLFYFHEVLEVFAAYVYCGCAVCRGYVESYGFHPLFGEGVVFVDVSIYDSVVADLFCKPFFAVFEP